MSYPLMKTKTMQVTILYENRNSACKVYFDGEHYVFIDNFKGVFAIATRKGFVPELENQFIIYYGNDFHYQKSDDVAALECDGRTFLSRCWIKIFLLDVQ